MLTAILLASSRVSDKDVYDYYRAQMRSQIWAKCFAHLSRAPRSDAPTMFLRNSAARRTARSRPVKVIFSLMRLYPGDGSDCSQPALKLVSAHAREEDEMLWPEPPIPTPRAQTAAWATKQKAQPEDAGT